MKDTSKEKPEETKEKGLKEEEKSREEAQEPKEPETSKDAKDSQGIPEKEVRKEDPRKEVSSTKAGRKKKMGTAAWILTALVLVIAAAGIAAFVYTNNPSYRAQKALEEGERYLEGMDYDRAVASFLDALRIDPDNTEIAAAIYGHLEEFLVIAQDSREAGDYSTERQMASYVLDFDAAGEQGNALLADALPEGMDAGRLFSQADDLLKDADKQELLEQANQNFADKEYEAAKEKFEQAKEKGAADSEVEPRLSLCEVYQEILDLCEKEKRYGDNGLLNLLYYMDSDKFGIVADYMDVENPQHISRGSIFVEIGERDGAYYVMSEKSTNEKEDTVTGTGVVSSANTYAVYKGEWANGVPNGNGSLKVWYKNNVPNDGDSFTATFKDGVVDGSFALSTPMGEISQTMGLSAEAGAINLFQVDEAGNLWLCDRLDNERTYVIVDVKEENGKVADYVAGVPGFGGSDAVAKVERLYLDKEPPVIICENRQRVRHSLLEGIKAIDNVGGDITKRMTYTKEQTENSKGYKYDGYCGYKVVYSVTDAAGNTGTLTVQYDYEYFCGLSGYTVVSVK